MKIILKYRGRCITTKDIELIQSVIVSNPEYGRRALSQEICRIWNWVQPNGHLKDMICRGLLLQLEKLGYLKLPPRKWTPNNPFVNRKKPEYVDVVDSLVQDDLKNILPITIKQVRRTNQEKIINGLISQYHYLGYNQPVGEHLKYIVFAQNRPIACLIFSSSTWHLSGRDDFIGWSSQARQLNLHLLAYNTRFLILPWIRVPNLASYILSQCAKIIISDWQQIYNHPIYWLETIVDTERFSGTCYKAANWIFLGETSGLGLNNKTNKQSRSVKTIWGYPLSKNFRTILKRV